MATIINMEMNPKIRKDITTVANQCADHYINLIFERDKVTFLGYTNSSFCMCREFITNIIPYTFRVEDGILLSMMSCYSIEFKIDKKTITVSALDNTGKMIRQVQIKLNTDTLVDYQADYYQNLIDGLRSGVSCNGLSQFNVFDKISRINNKNERGIVIADNQIYTEGEGYKFFAKFKSDFNCFVLSDNLKSLINFVEDNSSILYEQNGYIIAKDNKECYFGIRVANPMNTAQDLERVVAQPSLCEFTISISDLKSNIKPIRSTAVNTAKIIFQIKSSRVVIARSDTVFNIPYLFENVSGESDVNVELDFKLFNKLIQALHTDEKTRIKVYPTFICVYGSMDSILLIARG